MIYKSAQKWTNNSKFLHIFNNILNILNIYHIKEYFRRIIRQIINKNIIIDFFGIF
jgi:hypothetical protein